MGEQHVNGRPVDYSMLPDHMQDGMRRYLEDGIEPGGFACAALANDLVGAAGKADMTNLHALHKWAMWLYNECPRYAWGSYEAIDRWIKRKEEERNADKNE
jgi:hypothetical protein